MYITVHGGDIPNSFKQVILGKNAGQWWKAMQEEMDMLQKRGIWKLINRLKDRKVIGCRWVYTIKYGPNGNILRYKARLVAQGHSQIPSLNYSNTFSPTVQLESLQVILHYAAAHRWYRSQDDITGTFLHSKIDHEIYMCQPDGFNNGSRQVAALLLSLYGIKQGSHLWNKHMNRCLTMNGFICLLLDYAIYTHQTETGQLITAIHVDNALTVANTKHMLAETCTLLHRLFEMKEEDPDWLMNFQLIDNHKRHTVTILQTKYINTLLE